ncbi:MAG: IS3 family transposase [Saprospiraceae bacterium]
MAESAFALLKRERVYQRQYLTQAEVLANVFDDIQRVYHHQRRYSFTQGLTSRHFKERYAQQAPFTCR